VLRTRAPVATSIATVLPLDLHVLGLPLAFILSQDQTLHCKKSLNPKIVIADKICYCSFHILRIVMLSVLQHPLKG
jgi:hypothetical protein